VTQAETDISPMLGEPLEGGASAQALPQPRELLAGRYRIGSELGRGGMSTVFSAWDEHLERPVALKVLKPELLSSSEALERFTKEARSLARIDNEHVVRIIDFGTTEQGIPFIVLELLRGRDLWRYVRETVSLSVGHIVRLVIQVCEGLAAAHDSGAVHRDLKPENIFVVDEPDGTECVKLLDFGIAKSLSSGRALTLERSGLGSPGYMAPEQLTDARNADARSDIWSVGVVLYELFVGKTPFEGETPYQICMRVLRAPIEPIAKLRPDLPPGLVAVIERCLQRDRAQRFQCAAELAEALKPFTDLPARELTAAERESARNSARKADEVPTLMSSSSGEPSRITGTGAAKVAVAVIAAFVAGLFSGWSRPSIAAKWSDPATSALAQKARPAEDDPSAPAARTGAPTMAASSLGFRDGAANCVGLLESSPQKDLVTETNDAFAR
jgi:serine/threonine-protein kinase